MGERHSPSPSVRIRFSVFVEDSKASAEAAASNFGGLVLCCMDSYDSEKRRILQHFFKIYKICILLHRSDLKLESGGNVA